MSERRFGIILLLLCFSLCILSCPVMAASTAQANEPIAVDTACDLTIGYGYEGNAFSDLSVKLYQIASVSADFHYTLTPSFATSGLTLNGIQTNGEWNTIRSTLEANIAVNKIAPLATATTSAAGQACFTPLTPGLYLASAVEGVQGEQTCFFDSMLIALPGLGADGLWQYTVTVTAKPQVLPPIQPDEKQQLKVVKLWKGDEGRTDRPTRIEVAILRNGNPYDTAILSEENNWSYSWSAPEDGADWKVTEPAVPTGYTMTVEQRGDTFVVTNTRTEQPTPPTPQTGDTADILLYTMLMFISGTMLIVLGIIGKRKRHEEN